MLQTQKEQVMTRRINANLVLFPTKEELHTKTAGLAAANLNLVSMVLVQVLLNPVVQTGCLVVTISNLFLIRGSARCCYQLSNSIELYI